MSVDAHMHVHTCNVQCTSAFVWLIKHVLYVCVCICKYLNVSASLHPNYNFQLRVIINV